ncbi:Piso0_005686 [Millerozyma farinosa CBS 7064]|uniref:Piso0_005686 protein n=1 Tax=Pichia sorbitophila (strain ATCC MYA-4447 / BCRC 22081 / CBS 7064 / NBRC 10061 / NRRL Y-12695) TaxID=559304 RepID=G8Y2N0_PICSO|nr:Piso0_005686 [Millerozyma farinosa CBS 7064]
MLGFIFKFILNKVIRENQLNRFGVEDPYYEYIPYPNSKGENTKYKKVKRKVPEGLSKNDVDVLHKVRVRAFRYDMLFSFIGIKFGLASLIGLIPVAGQIITGYWSLKILQTARQVDDGLPLDLQLLFMFNIVVDVLLGLIPIIGDIVEIGYKANSRNFLLLEKHLYRVGQKNLGNIGSDEVRPNFLNDKVQPFMETNLKPNAMKAGESIKELLNGSHASSGSSTSGSRAHSSGATTYTSDSSMTTPVFSDSLNKSSAVTMEKIKSSNKFQ